jgi:excisionase family DNA binding protein
VSEVAKLLQVSKSTVYKYTENNTIPCRKVGSRTRITQDDVNQYIADSQKKSKEDKTDESSKSQKAASK